MRKGFPNSYAGYEAIAILFKSSENEEMDHWFRMTGYEEKNPWFLLSQK
jgi:hypothetical protein